MSSRLLYYYSNTAEIKDEEEPVLLRRPREERLEGEDHDPAPTNVVDHQYYENKQHTYPVTLWKEYEAGRALAF
jgi:hypothetical protein